jgi:MscS family membrane protein
MMKNLSFTSSRCLRFGWAGLWGGLLWMQAQALAQTTTNAPAPLGPPVAATLKAEPNIWLTFGLDRLSVLQYRPVADIPLWQYLASLIYIFLAFYVSKVLDAFISGRAKQWAERTTTKLDDLLIELLRGPIKIVAFVVLLHIGMQVYSWPTALAGFFSKALKIIVAVSLTYVVLKAVDALTRVWHERTTTPENEQFSRQLLPLISKSVKVFLVIVAVLVTSQNLGLNVTGLIASLSIGGLAVGLAAQDTLANLFGAVAVLVDKPFRVGDRVQIEGVDGTVESIGFRSTRVRNADGHLITVPNKTMGNAIIINVTRRPSIRTLTTIGLTYDTSPERVKRATEVLTEIYRSHPMILDVWISFDKFADSALNLTVIHWWKGTVYKDYLAGLQELNLKIKERFDAEGLSFAFPTRTLLVRHETEPAAPVEPRSVPPLRGGSG